MFHAVFLTISQYIGARSAKTFSNYHSVVLMISLTYRRSVKVSSPSAIFKSKSGLKKNECYGGDLKLVTKNQENILPFSQIFTKKQERFLHLSWNFIENIVVRYSIDIFRIF